MSWINDLTSTLGIPAGAGIIAAALYAACATAEKTARPEALKEVSRVLKDPTWTHPVRPSAIFERIFNWVFGERHLSWKCLARSAGATTTIAASISIYYYIDLHNPSSLSALYYRLGNYHIDSIYSTRPPSLSELLANFINLRTPILLILGFVADYIALAKTRFLMRRLVGNMYLLMIGVLDICLSIIISIIFMSISMVIILESGLVDQPNFFIFILNHQKYTDQVNTCLFQVFAAAVLWYMLTISTLFTSLWIIVTGVTVGLIKLLAPVQRVITWFFDVEKYPLQSIGIVSSTLVVTCSLVWSFVRAVI